jgi:hypothetical protein
MKDSSNAEGHEAFYHLRILILSKDGLLLLIEINLILCNKHDYGQLNLLQG